MQIKDCRDRVLDAVKPAIAEMSETCSDDDSK